MRAFAAGQENSELGAWLLSVANVELRTICLSHGNELPDLQIRRSKHLFSTKFNHIQRAKDLLSGNTLWREFRRIPVARLAARLGIAPYMKLNTPYMGDIATSEVVDQTGDSDTAALLPFP